METDKKQKCLGCEKKRKRLLEETKNFQVDQMMNLERYNKKMEEKEKKIERKKGLAK